MRPTIQDITASNLRILVLKGETLNICFNNNLIFVPSRLRVTEETVREEFGKFGEVVDVRGAGLFDEVQAFSTSVCVVH